jgi:hypothetical protein
MKIATSKNLRGESMTRRHSPQVVFHDSKAQCKIESSTATSAEEARRASRAWTLFTQIVASGGGRFEVRISVGYGVTGDVSRRCLPALRDFPTAASAAAFLMRWVEEYHDLNRVKANAGPKKK